MTRQCYLIYADQTLTNRMREKGFRGTVFTHKNKSKKYPYSSDRQNNRKTKNA